MKQNYEEFKLQNEFQNLFKRQINFIKFDELNSNLILIGDEKFIKIIKDNEIIKEINNEEYILSVKISTKLSKLFIGGFNYLKIYNLNENYNLEHQISKKNLGFNDIHIFDNYVTVADGDKLILFDYLDNYNIYKKLELENNINFFKIINNMLIISDGNLYFYNLDTFKLLKTFKSNSIYSFNYIFINENILYTNEKDKEITLINIKDFKIIKSFNVKFVGLKILIKNSFLYLSNLNNLIIFNKNNFNIYQKFNLNNKHVTEFKLIQDNLYLINNDNKLLLLKKLKKNTYKKGLIIKKNNNKSKEKSMDKKIINKIKNIENKINNLEKLIINNKYDFENFQNKILKLINEKIDNFEEKMRILNNEKLIKYNKKNFFSPNIKIKTKNILNQTINKSFDYNKNLDNKIILNKKKKNTNDNEKFLKIISKKLKKNFNNNIFKKYENSKNSFKNNNVNNNNNNSNNNNINMDESIFTGSSMADNDNKENTKNNIQNIKGNKKLVPNKIDRYK